MITPGQYAHELSQRADGPHDDQATAEAAGLAAETIRYLIYAAAHGGITEPATVYAIAGELSAAAYRLPQVLTQMGEWIATEISAGRVAGDQSRPARQLGDDARAVYSQAAGHASGLAAALSDAHNLAGTLRASAPETSIAP
jgi:hypothetical protein